MRIAHCLTRLYDGASESAITRGQTISLELILCTLLRLNHEAFGRAGAGV